VEELGSDVTFEALELVDERGGADAEGMRRFPERGIGHGDGEAAEPFGACPAGERAMEVVGRGRVFGGWLTAAVCGVGGLAWTRLRRTLGWLAVALYEGVDVWLGEGLQELGAAGGGGHRRGGGGAVDQGGADVVFEASDLGDEGAEVGSDVAGGGVDAAVLHDLPESAQALPAVQLTVHGGA
jgi:hypothetical protein